MLGGCDEVWIPFVVLAEMKAGFYGGTRQSENESLLLNPLNRETVAILYADRETAGQYARLFVQLKRAGLRCREFPSAVLPASSLDIRNVY
ncbi:MAG: hypothetical protein HYZ37_05230 [Candidatus Solibacter usitatus]|nr:hypothetical protein [Candidatus Solibacter usitatus]